MCRSTVVLCLVAVTLVPTPADGGDVDSPANPDSPASAMFTLESIYQRLATGAEGAKRGTGFVEPSAGPGSTGHTLDEVMALCPAADNPLGASLDQVLFGRTFWSLRTDGTWGLQTGSMPNIGKQDLTPGTSNQSISKGFHDGTGVVLGDPDLTTGNLRAGVTLFGVAGDPNVVDTSSGNASAAEILEDRTAWVGGSEVTGTISPRVLSDTTTVVEAGIYPATDLATVEVQLAAENLRAGVNVFGIDGDPNVVNTASGNALSTDVLDGKKAWVDGSEVTGTILTRTLSDATTAVAGGFYQTTDLATVDADLVSGNVRSGVTMFGVEGDPNVVNTESGDALSTDILVTRKAWVDGVEVTGNLAIETLSDTTTEVESGFYQATDLAIVDSDLAAENVRAGIVIYGIQGDPNVVDTETGDALAADLRAGKKAWVDGSEVTGTILAQTLSDSTTVVPAGIYSASDLTAVDPDLAPGNVRAGSEIFGIDGDSNVVNTASGDALAADIRAGKKAWVDGSEVTGTDPPAAVARTGQASCWDSAGALIVCSGTGQDGDLEKGVEWPNPRFTENGDGTVSDNLTGLIWLRDASCASLVGTDSEGRANWETALSAAAQLAAGNCGLTDGSSAGDWRLPNLKEFLSLIHWGLPALALPNALGTAEWTEGDAFSGVVPSTQYWSSTTSAHALTDAWTVHFLDGHFEHHFKSSNYYVWPVRGGQ